ncbi:MAG: hypothetical protein GJT30_13575 [Geobacter sp.]|nr:hypothetical protein [Geobacter sp.]
MKKCIVLMAALLTATVASIASAEDKVSGDAYLGTYSKYLFRGLDSSANQYVVQGGMDLSYKNITLSYWTNVQTRGAGVYKRSDNTETDITLNYAFAPFELVSMNVGNTFYTFDVPGVNDTNELYLKATLNTLLAPTLAVYWDWDESTKNGLFYTLSVGHTIQAMKNLGVNLGALVSYNMENPSASAAYNNLHNYELSVSADYSLTDQIKISPSYLYSNAFNSVARNAGVNDESVIGIKAAFVF